MPKSLPTGASQRRDTAAERPGDDTPGKSTQPAKRGLIHVARTLVTDGSYNRDHPKNEVLEVTLMHHNKGFTLVEILIVVIILGILAAIVIPQFTEASEDAQESALRSDLQTVRAQIELYRVQHGMYPGFTRADDGTLSEWDADEFIAQLTGTTDRDGDTSASDLGPYLQQFPSNSFVADADAAASVESGDPDGTGAGWSFNPTTGKFRANDADSDHQAY